jgi:GTP cyclohydrolase I
MTLTRLDASALRRRQADDAGHDHVGPALVSTVLGTTSERRPLDPAESAAFEEMLGALLTRLGLDVGTPGTTDTPRRMLAALVEATDGYDGDPKLITAFPTECHGGSSCEIAQIVEGPIPFHALCEHHALPFYGHAYVGYVAGDEIIGISKLTRLVRLYARRFTVQERLGEQIADGLVSLVAPRGIAVHLDASHLCTQMRGVEEHSRTVTTFWRGEFEDPELRREFLLEVRSHRHG